MSGGDLVVGLKMVLRFSHRMMLLRIDQPIPDHIMVCRSQEESNEKQLNAMI